MGSPLAAAPAGGGPHSCGEFSARSTRLAHLSVTLLAAPHKIQRAVGGRRQGFSVTAATVCDTQMPMNEQGKIRRTTELGVQHGGTDDVFTASKDDESMSSSSSIKQEMVSDL